jgi:glycosyltransferase involved in cell wall biosynthesis
MIKYSGRLALQQRVLPGYRVPFFDLLAGQCSGGMSLFAGQARPEEMIVSGMIRVANFHEAKNLHLFRGLFYLCYQQGMTRWLEEYDPDALIVEANPRYLSTPSAVRWMHQRGRKVIGWGLGSPRTTGIRKNRRLAFINQFDGMISYSQRGADEYAALGFPREKIFVAHNSVALAPSSNVKSRASRAEPVILFVGRLQARKPVDDRRRWT